MPFSSGSQPAAAATLRHSSTVSSMIAWPSPASRMSPDVPRIRQDIAASEQSMIHLSHRSCTMLVCRPPSTPVFLTAASSSASAARAGLPSSSPKEIAANGLVCRIAPSDDSATPTRARPPTTLASPNLAASTSMWRMPFSSGTTVVFGPDGRRDRLDRRVEIVGLAGQQHDVVRPALGAAQHRLHLLGDVALGALDHQAVALQRARAARRGPGR